jgi:hypothetical protein
MPTISPMTPQTGSVLGTVNIIASTASTNILLPLGGGNQVRIINTASIQVFVSFGASTVTASTGWSMPILVNCNPPERFTLDQIATGSAGSQLTYMAAIASSATTLPIYVTRGEGF